MSSRWLLLLGVWLLYGSFGLVATSLAPMASLIIEDLSMTHAQMGMAMGAGNWFISSQLSPRAFCWIESVPNTALALGGILVGSSALARVFAGDATSLIAAVMLFGLGGPIISAGAPKVVVSIFEGSSRGLAMGIYMTGPAIGGIVSLTTTHSFLLPWFNQDWRDVMALWTLVTFASAAIWFLIATLNRSSDSAESAAASVSQIRVIGELISKPTVMIVLLMSISVFMFNHGLNNWLPELLQSHGLSAVHAGYWAALPTVIGIIGSLIIPRLATPERRFNILLALSAAAFLASLLLRFNEPESLITGLLLQGIARSSLMTVLILTLVELPEIGERYAGVASGLFFSAAELGGVMGPLTLGLLYTPSGGFTNGLTLLTMITLTMILGSLLLKQRARASSA